MTAPIKPLTQRPAWKALAAHHKQIQKLPLRKLFANDAKRGQRFTAEAAGLFLDFSKNCITEKTLKLLLQLADESGLRGKMDAMFRGEKINVTENRAVLHVALRAPKGETILVDGKNVVPEVHAVLDKMAEFSNRVRSGEWKGHTGKRIKNVINIGIGGSGTGLADATRWTRPSAFRRCWRLARTIFKRCSPAFTRWTNISAPRPLKKTCRF
jgi:glucose-6-phosphate isomerase